MSTWPKEAKEVIRLTDKIESDEYRTPDEENSIRRERGILKDFLKDSLLESVSLYYIPMEEE